MWGFLVDLSPVCPPYSSQVAPPLGRPDREGFRVIGVLRREPLELSDEFRVAVVVREWTHTTAGRNGRGIALQIYSRYGRDIFQIALRGKKVQLS